MSVLRVALVADGNAPSIYHFALGGVERAGHGGRASLVVTVNARVGTDRLGHTEYHARGERDQVVVVGGLLTVAHVAIEGDFDHRDDGLTSEREFLGDGRQLCLQGSVRLDVIQPGRKVRCPSSGIGLYRRDVRNAVQVQSALHGAALVAGGGVYLYFDEVDDRFESENSVVHTRAVIKITLELHSSVVLWRALV